MEVQGFISNDLTRYLFEAFKESNRTIERLRKQLVDDLTSLTLVQLIDMRSIINSREEVHRRLSKDLLKSFKMTEELYNFLVDHHTLFIGRYTYDVKDELQKRISRDPSVYQYVSKFKALNYFYWD